MTIYRAWICPCCNNMLIALERPQSSSWLFLSLMVHAGCVCVAIIHWTLTWTTGSLTCAQMLMHAIAHGGVRTRTPKESLHWKLTLGRKSLSTQGNRTCVSGVTVRCCNHPSLSLSLSLSEVIFRSHFLSLINSESQQTILSVAYFLVCAFNLRTSKRVFRSWL